MDCTQVTPRRVTHLILVTLFCAASLRAEIEWENTRAKLAAEPGDTAVTAEYRFEVKGEGALAIEKVDTGCACASEILDKTLYARGDKGTLKIRFDIGDREGLFSTPMLVTWQQGETRKEDTLFLQVDIPVMASLSRRVLVFQKSKPLTQTLEITANSDLGITLRLGEATGGYKAKLKSAKNGRYTLSVTPGEQLGNGYVEVQARRNSETVKTWRVFLRIQP